VNVHFENIRPADWRATHVLRPDLKLLADSIAEDGWVYPIIVRTADSRIIDGFHRWQVAQADKRILARDEGVIPVEFRDIDEIDAMILHARLNRARGSIVAKYLSMMVTDILASRKYTEDDLQKMLRMSVDEIGLLVDGSLIKHRNLKEYQYSKAWVPIEVRDGTSQDPGIERPPNPDR
jgi:ParB-like chromosome segregation protein Spo0J